MSRGPESIADISDDTLFSLVVGEDGALRYDEWNAKCERVSGFTCEAVRGKTAVEVFGVDVGSAFEAHYRDCIAAGAPIAYDEDVVFLGHLETATTRLYPVFGAEGRVERILGAGTNMGPQRRSEAALRDSEDRYRLLIETLQEGVWAVDASGLTTFVNPAMARMLGYEVAEMTGRSLHEFMDAEGVATTKRNLARRAAGISEQHEFVFLRKDGNPVRTLLETSPLRDETGAFVGALAGVLDITPLRRAEEARTALERRLLEAQRLESLGLLSGGIAHDFNNLLTAILLRSSAGLAVPEVPAPLQAALRGIEEAARAGAQLCQQLLAYSGRGRFDVRGLDLGEVVRETAELIRVSVPRDVELRFDLAPELPATQADLPQMRQVILNLILNAAESIERRPGRVTIATGTLLVPPGGQSGGGLTSALAAGPHVVLSVSDTGRGMTADTLARIWDPFFTTKFTGRGLGLSAVLGIVHGHGGALRVTSVVDHGTTFEVFLPSTGEVASRPTPASVAPAIAPEGLVLVVDDEPFVREVAVHLIEDLGYRVLSAPGGREGLALFERHAAEIDCVLLDLTMPGFDGEAVFRAIRAESPGAPVILMSGYSEQEALARFVGQGLAGFLEKPFDLRTLERCLRAAIRGRRATES